MFNYLNEKDFIHEEYGKNPFLFWKWLLIILLLTCLFYAASLFYFSTLSKQYHESPFLQVTNREISLFLWQNPSYMRVHAKNKNGYLPAFQYAERIGLDPSYAEDYVIAPPELLFLYHTWKRLLGNILISRSIRAGEFQLFLIASPEWLPRYWPAAPSKYIKLIEGLSQFSKDHILNADLPLAVQQAFVGWKNYFFEGSQINSFAPSKEFIQDFLAQYPDYARPLWCNIVGNHYLLDFEQSSLSPFLRAALFNFSKISLAQ